MRESSKKFALCGGLLLLITVSAYVPAINGGFIWDDDAYVTENETLRSLDGLYRIWFEIGAVPHYYPIIHTTFWVEYHLSGLDLLGYHLVNVILHWLNAIVLWIVLTRLSVPGAWLVAAVFSLHPVHVESVAWITERKNVLSGFFYLAALLSYIRYLGLGSENVDSHFSSSPDIAESKTCGGLRQYYVLALLFYLCALLSKTVTCTLPALGFFDVYPMRCSFVADHFQYLASLGLITLFVAMMSKLSERYLPRLPKYAAVVVLVVLLGTLVWKQGYIYKDLETLWRDTIAKNPSSWMAYNNLGMELGIQGRFDEAIPAFHSALRLKSDNYKAHFNLGKTLSQMGKLSEAVSHYSEATQNKG
ncbi:MAG: tetratricopeptide repeat protein [Desulfobacterales bacterium]